MQHPTWLHLPLDSKQWHHTHPSHMKWQNKPPTLADLCKGSQSKLLHYQKSTTTPVNVQNVKNSPLMATMGDHSPTQPLVDVTACSKCLSEHLTLEQLV